MSEPGAAALPIRDRLRAALPTAMKARDKPAVAAIRTALAAIDNAEAVDQVASGLEEVGSVHIAGTVGGLGAGEVARAALGEAAIRALVEHEIAERRGAAADYERLGQAAEAERLVAEADALAAVVASG